MIERFIMRWAPGDERREDFVAELGRLLEHARYEMMEKCAAVAEREAKMCESCGGIFRAHTARRIREVILGKDPGPEKPKDYRAVKRGDPVFDKGGE